MLAPYRKIGGFGKCWRLTEKQADLKNIGASQKIVGFTKCWRLAEI
jgi:hypothetical protein